ncbi:MAG: AMP-binding protein [Myxococcales bacterium]
MFETRPWLKFYGDVAITLEYPKRTMYQAIAQVAARYPKATALEFMGRRTTYEKLLADVDRCADVLSSMGLKKGDRATLALPNTPHAVIAFYALNKLGVVASMIHPLSAPPEIEFFLRESDSTWAFGLDAFYPKFREVLARTPTRRVVVCSISEYLGPLQRLGFALTTGRKIAPVPNDPEVLRWPDLMSRPAPAAPAAALDPDELAVILYSGGTTGRPKGIMLSSMNFNCLGQQTLAQHPVTPGMSMLAILPMFHGFGLGVCVHTILLAGGVCLLVPRFTAESVAKLIRKKRPNFMAGVPTLYEALTRSPDFRKADLSCLTAAFAGGDRVPHSIKEEFDAVVRARGGTVVLREGYGLTECVTACMVMPAKHYRQESMGVPYPDALVKVVDRETLAECPPGTEGEICVNSPTLMLGYLNEPAETAKTLRRHADGRVWLHTGDAGTMDADGFFYFKQRFKRLVKVSGVAVYPTQIEDVLHAHPEVALACAIGIPDLEKMARIKAFVVLREPGKASDALKQQLLEHCKKNLNTWSCPRELEFRPDLPKTLVGKVAYTALEKEEEAARAARA